MATYYIDSDSGSDSNNGTGTGTAWKTLAKFLDLSSLSPGDKAILRRGRTAQYGEVPGLMGSLAAELKISGSISQPIIVEADYGDSWSDFSNSAQTYTATFGSKTLTASTTITGISVGEWIYNSTDGDNSKDFSYEVAGISGSTLTLYLPFKGSTGSGKTFKVMDAAPKIEGGGVPSSWNVLSAAFSFYVFQGVLFNCVVHGGINDYTVRFYDSSGFIFKDVVFKDVQGGDPGTPENTFPGYRALNAHRGCVKIILKKCRFFTYLRTIASSTSNGSFKGAMHDCLIDGDDNVFTEDVSIEVSGLELTTWDDWEIFETEFTGYGSYNNIKLHGGIGKSPDLRGRNIKFGSAAADINLESSSHMSDVKIEDYDNTIGDNRLFTFGSDSTIFQSDTSVVRSGGSTTSIKVNPSTELGTNWEPSRLKLLDLPIYSEVGQKTYKIYFKSSATANWTANPTASELLIEIEHWGHTSNNFRKITKSTATLNFTGSTAWQSISVTASSAQAGMAYLRAYYAKGKESSKSNLFYIDPNPVIS